MNTKSETSPDTSLDSSTLQSPARFPLGQLVATPGALELLELHRVGLFDLLARHLRGDWGDVGAEDAHANDQALIHGYRLLSCYTLVPGDPDTRVWIISEADRSVTTALKPEEY
nr:type I restriction endonuclease subunit M [Comamonas thiooxydans]